MATKGFVDDGQGNVKALKGIRLEWVDGKMSEVAGSEFEIPCDAAFLAMGFTNPMQSVLDAFGIHKDARNNAHANTEGEFAYKNRYFHNLQKIRQPNS